MILFIRSSKYAYCACSVPTVGRRDGLRDSGLRPGELHHDRRVGRLYAGTIVAVQKTGRTDETLKFVTGRSNSCMDKLFELTHVSQLKKFVRTRIWSAGRRIFENFHARPAAPAGAAPQQTVGLCRFNGHPRLCFFMPPFPGVWAPGPPRISISSSLRFIYLLEALKTLDLWILQVAKHAGPRPPTPGPNFSKFFMPRAARARRPPGGRCFFKPPFPDPGQRISN